MSLRIQPHLNVYIRIALCLRLHPTCALPALPLGGTGAAAHWRCHGAGAAQKK